MRRYQVKIHCWVLALFLGAFPALAFGADRYLKQGGTGDGSSDAAAWGSAWQANQYPFQPGDHLYVKRGGKWQETLTLQAAAVGTPAAPLVIEAYGTGPRPVFTGRGVLSLSWSTYSGNVRQASTSDPGRVWQDDVELKRVQSLDQVAAGGDWYWESGVLYVFATSFPPPGTFEAATVLGHAGDFRAFAPEYWEFHGLEFQGGTRNVEFNGSNHILVESCAFTKYTAQYGLIFDQGASGSAGSNDYNIVQNSVFDRDDNIVHDFDYGGMASGNGDEGVTISAGVHNEIHHNYFRGQGHGAIGMNGHKSLDHSASYNLIHDNEIDGGVSDYSRGFGWNIQGDSLTIDDAIYCAGNEFYRNYIHDISIGNQIGGWANKIYYNIIDTVRRTHWRATYQLVGIGLTGSAPTDYNEIVNNVVVSCAGPGISISEGAGMGPHNSIINNIIAYNGNDPAPDYVADGWLHTEHNMANINLYLEYYSDGQTFDNNLFFGRSENCIIYHDNYNKVEDNPVILSWRVFQESMNGVSAPHSPGEGVDIVVGNVWGNPYLSSDHRVSEGSAAIDSGQSWSIGGQWDGTDYFGNPVPYDSGTVDIGANELTPVSADGAGADGGTADSGPADPSPTDPPQVDGSQTDSGLADANTTDPSASDGRHDGNGDPTAVGSNPDSSLVGGCACEADSAAPLWVAPAVFFGLLRRRRGTP